MEGLKPTCILIRPVTQDDATAWLDMRCAMWPDGDSDHALEIVGFFAGTLIEPEAVLIAETDDHVPIGVAELAIRLDLPGLEGQRVGYVEGLFICPEARGHNAARRLLQQSRDWARARQCSHFASDRAGRIIVERRFSL